MSPPDDLQPSSGWDSLARAAALACGAPRAVVLWRPATGPSAPRGAFGCDRSALEAAAPALDALCSAPLVERADAANLPLGARAVLAAGAGEGPGSAWVVVLDERPRAFEAAQREAARALAQAARAWSQDADGLVEAREAEEHLRRQLQRADRLATVGKLGAGIAHELGTPLAVVAGRARQLATGVTPADQVQAVAKGIAEQADRMTAIIRALLDFARRRGPRMGRFDARVLVRQAAGLLEPVASRKGVRLVVEEGAAPLVAQFDGSQLLQVLSNLVVNAVQATAAGGQVRLSVGEGEFTPPPSSGLTPGRYVRLSVADTGVGIAPDDLPRIFEPFFTTKDTGEGTGLGLPVAQGIVRDHDGWISVESTRGQGSVFTIHLPC